ncbi:hypothetical protein ACS0TY_019685 [Phlomoides rotata]
MAGSKRCLLAGQQHPGRSFGSPLWTFKGPGGWPWFFACGNRFRNIGENLQGRMYIVSLCDDFG